jgi:hypothetical protein
MLTRQTGLHRAADGPRPPCRESPGQTSSSCTWYLLSLEIYVCGVERPAANVTPPRKATLVISNSQLLGGGTESRDEPGIGIVKRLPHRPGCRMKRGAGDRSRNAGERCWAPGELAEHLNRGEIEAGPPARGDEGGKIQSLAPGGSDARCYREASGYRL